MKRSIVTGLCLSLVLLTSRVRAEAADFTLPGVTVYPERNLLVTPGVESRALDIATSTFSSRDLTLLKPAVSADALKFMPGVHTETRGRKFKHLHSFRGQIYPYPHLALDGFWQRESQELTAVYPGRALEGVTVIRSSATLFFGLADVVGVINLVPRRFAETGVAGRPTELGIEGGSHGSYRGFALHEAEKGNLRLHLGSQFYQTDGPSGRNAAERMSSVFGSFQARPAPRFVLEGSGFFLHGYRELQTPDPKGPALASLKNRIETYDPITYAHANLRGLHAWSDKTTTEWKVFLSDRQARYKREKLDLEGPGPGDAVTDEDDREYGLQITQAVGLTLDNTVRFGLFAHRWTAPEGKQSYTGSRQDVSSYALVLADEHRAGRWTLDAGVRYARSYLHDFSGPAFDISGESTQLQPVRNEWEDAIVSGTFGVTVDLDPENSLFAHVGTGERRSGPGAVRSDGTRPASERRYTGDAGWRLLWGKQGDGRLTLGGFLVYRRDAVTRVAETGTDALGNPFHFTDNQDIRQYGIESELRSPGFWNDRLNVFAGATWLQSDARQPGDTFSSYREIPEWMASGGIQAAIDAWDGALFARHVGRYENFRFAQGGNVHDLGRFLDLTLTAGKRFGPDDSARLYAAVDNLLDDTYSTVVGWSDSGRRYRVGLEASF